MNNKINLISRNHYLLHCILLICINIIFFSRFFYPNLQILSTPDFTTHDVWNFNFPIKLLLSQAIKSNTLPLWTPLIGTGMPLYAEGEVGTFSIINLILYKFFSIGVAFNLNYVIVFILFSLGMYWCAREEKISPHVSFYCAVIFTFTGSIIVQMPHLSHLQTFSFFLLIYAVLKRMQNNQYSKVYLLIPFLIAQQIFSGHFQYVFMTILFFMIKFISSKIINKEKINFSILFKHSQQKKLFILSVLGFTLSSLQLLPLFEYFTYSTRTSLERMSVSYGYHIKHLFQFISPYILGDIRFGTYPNVQFHSYYWETLAYIGIIPLVLTILSLLFKKKVKKIKLYWTVILILFILTLETFSPLYFLYTFPPLSFFRVYSRFLLYISFLLILLSGFSFDLILNKYKTSPVKKAMIFSFIFLLSSIDIMYFAYTYHMLKPMKQISQQPEFIKYITSNNRVISLYDTNTRGQYFSKFGWSNKTNYEYYNNFLSPNYNVIHTIPNVFSYFGLTLKTHNFLWSQIHAGIHLDRSKEELSISDKSRFMLQIFNVGYITSLYPIRDKYFSLLKTISPTDSTLSKIYLYIVSDSRPYYYITNNVVNASTFLELSSIFDSKIGDLPFDAILSTDKRSISTDQLPLQSIQLSQFTMTKREFQIKSDRDTNLIISEMYYPGWKAYINNKRTEIVSANYIFMGLSVPKGEHNILLKFQPNSLLIGVIITLIGSIVYAIYIIREIYRS